MIDTILLKNNILELAISGKLSMQYETDGNAEGIYCKLRNERKIQNAEKRIKSKEFAPVLESEYLFDIPDSWKWIRLGEIASVISKGTTPRGGSVAYLESGIGFLRAENLIGYDQIECSNLKYVDEATHMGFLKRSRLQAGDILISIAGTLGRTGLVREKDLPLNTNQAVAFVRFACRETIDEEYVAYILNAPTIQKKLGNKKVDMAIPNLSLDVIANSVIPVPPLPEQKRLVKRVKDSFEILDKIDSLQTSYKTNIEMLKDKLIDAGIQGKLTEQLPEDGTAEALFAEIQAEKNKLVKEKKIKKEKASEVITEDEIPFEIPDNWKWVRFGDIYSLTNGVASRGSEGGTLHPVLRLADLSDGEVSLNAIRDIKLTDKEFESHMVKNGDLIIIRVNGSRDKVASAFFYSGDVDISYCDHLFCGHRYTDYVDANYIRYVYKAGYIRQLIEPEIKTTAGQNSISQTSMAKLIIPLPPYAEQVRIVDKLESLLKLI